MTAAERQRRHRRKAADITPSDLETARAWLVEHIEGYNWAMPGSTAQRAPALAELLASARGVDRAQPEPARRDGDNG